MKYAKYLASQSIPEWQSHYFKYKKLKKELKVLVRVQESNNPTKFLEAQQGYVDMLYEELETVNQFFVTKEQELVEQYEQLKGLLADSWRRVSQRPRSTMSKFNFSRHKVKKNRSSSSAIFQDPLPHPQQDESPPQARKEPITITPPTTRRETNQQTITPAPPTPPTPNSPRLNESPTILTDHEEEGEEGITSPAPPPGIVTGRRPSTASPTIPSTNEITTRAPIQDSEAPTPFMPRQDSKAPQRVVLEKRFRFAIKRALEEIHRALSMLKDFSSLNSTGFRKIIKKHDKVPKFPSLAYFLEHEVYKCHFHTSEVPANLLKEIETIYGNMFTRGNIRQAADKLQIPPSEDSHDWVSCRSGMFIGACFILIVYLLGKSHDHPNNTPYHNFILYAFRFLGVPVLWIWLFATVMVIWNKRKINYVFIFGWNPRKHITPHNLFEVSALLSFLWLAAFTGYYSSLSGNEPFSKISEPIYPFVLLAAYLLCIFFPFDTFYRFSRWWMFKTIWRIVRAPFLPVKFKDFFYTDQFTSLNHTFSDMGDTMYFFMNAVWHAETPENIQLWTTRSFIYRPVLQAYPSFLRFLQCLRRYRDSKDRRQLINAGKYTFGVLTVTFSGIRRAFPQSTTILAVYCIIAAISTFYSWAWDVLMDWDLGHMSCKTKLRPKLMYSQPWIYYLAIVLDLLLRSVWAVTLGTTTTSIAFNSITMFTISSVTEVVRRFMWNIFRLESEHLKNCSHSNATAMPALLEHYRHMKTGMSKDHRLSRYHRDYEDEDMDEGGEIMIEAGEQEMIDLATGIRHRRIGVSEDN